MARYVTNEDTYQCNYCDLICAVRQLKPQHDQQSPVNLVCPRCDMIAVIETMSGRKLPVYGEIRLGRSDGTVCNN